MGNKITITTEKDGRTVIFEGSGTLTTTERVGKWVDTRAMPTSREGRGVEIKWDGIYTIREADHQRDTLEELAAAWEAAEVPTEGAPIREGDTVISSHYGGRMFNVFEFEGGGRFSAQPNYRVLSRAPRAPWQDLADDLADRSALMDEEAIEAAAKALHAAGWRKGARLGRRETPDWRRR